MKLSDPLDRSGVTRYGAASSDLRHAAGLLRAQAARRGMLLVEADEVDLAAAVMGADAWMMLSAATDLYSAPEYGQAASEVYMHVLLRAAGCGSETPVPSDRVITSEVAIASADGYRRWATEVVGEQAGEALRRAAGDLASAGMDTEFGRLGAVLVVAAETAEND